jgi:hypothetical protein
MRERLAGQCASSFIKSKGRGATNFFLLRNQKKFLTMPKAKKNVIPNEAESNDLAMKPGISEAKLRNRFEKVVLMEQIPIPRTLLGMTKV